MKALRFAGIAFVAGLLLFPLYLMVVHSFTPATVVMKFPPDLLPFDFTTFNYEYMAALPFFWRWVVNLGWITVATVALAVVVNCAAGYAFAYGKFPGKAVLFWLMMAPMFVTRFVLIISQYVLFGKLGLRGYLAVVIIQLFSSMQIFLARNYFSAIPLSMAESARMDGASEWTILMRIILPISKSLVGATVAFLGMSVMGDFIWQMLQLVDPAKKTLIVGLVQSTQRAGFGGSGNLGYNLAVGTVLIIPYMIIFAASSRYFISGVKITAEVER